ncbi:MAG: class I SAM-dependent methyltransferase [Clostridia bacterium]|nr:class I SAM-dependent methyltransferase [Clostridia bacterium]
MDDKTRDDNRTLIEFWNSAYVISEEEMEQCRKDPDSWKELVPSEKLFRAAETLGSRKKVLDYGCGMGWAGIVAAKSGCPDVTAVDVSETGTRAAEAFSDLYSLKDVMHVSFVSPEWLSTVPDGTYDGFICSNVLDVVPSVTAEEIIREAARVVTEDASVIIGLNYYMSPEKAAERVIELVDGNCVYMNGVLRLVSHSDEEWTEIFSPYFTVEKLDHFAWPGETEETRRLFFLMKK